MNKAYKFRIYPDAEQQILLAKTFGCVRFIYNKMLEDKIAHYEATKENLRVTPAQYKGEYEWLKEVDSLALANAQLHLESAYNNFFRDKKIGFPKFKSKKKSKISYTTNNQKNSIRIDGGKIKLPKLGFVKVVEHREIPETHKIKSCTISKTASGKYYISILVEYEYTAPIPVLDKNNAIGLDYASGCFYVDNQGTEAIHPKFYRQAQETLAKEQRILANMQYNSNNYQKQKRRVAKINERVTDQRKDWLHKESTRIADTYDYVCIEDLNMQNIAQCLKLGKATNDNGFGMFRVFLEYKLKDRGKQLVKIDKWYASSKICGVCGHKYKDLQMSERIWTCEECGTVHNRDENAAKNILREGLHVA